MTRRPACKPVGEKEKGLSLWGERVGHRVYLKATANTAGVVCTEHTVVIKWVPTPKILGNNRERSGEHALWQGKRVATCMRSGLLRGSISSGGSQSGNGGKQ